MKGFIFSILCTLTAIQLGAQQNCYSFPYQESAISKDPLLLSRAQAIETFIRHQLSIPGNTLTGRTTGNVIRIPVVVHVLYHYPSEKISDARIINQLDALNKCFRRTNADSVNTPAVFKPLAADCEIEFQLARSDARMRSTTGIIRKYTPITTWTADDKMKFSAEMGDDAWDPKSYLNIWVCNLDRLAGYASFPGGPADKDGIVLDFDVFGTNTSGAYGMGKTGVHEVGHWLGLKHLWGDALCGDDAVDDTPKQAGYTPGCPTGTRVTCNNGPNGDMYMNYMDFTSDPCMNLFTRGQKARMQALFITGGPRHDLLSSKGFDPPMIFESPLPEADPVWLHPQLYPNPATTDITLDLAYDTRWIGNMIRITNLQGQTIMNVMITSKNQGINISRLQRGLYFLAAKRGDGESILKRFIKL